MRPLRRTRLVFEPLECRRALAILAGGLVPDAPTVVAKAVSPSEIGLIWEADEPADAAVVIERQAATGGAFAELAVLTAGEHIYTDVSCWASTSYGYRVKLRGPGGDSGYSPVQWVTSLPLAENAFAAVTDLTVSPANTTTAMVSFSDVNGEAASYLVERSRNGLAYEVVASLGNTTAWRDTAVEPGGSYWYRVRGTGWQRATSDYSAPVRLDMPQRIVGHPIEPRDVSAEALSATSARIAWKPQDVLPTAYVIERSIDYDPWHEVAWVSIATTPVGATSYVDQGLAPERPYVYRVRAVRDGVGSPWGRPASDVMRVIFGEGVGVVTASRGDGGPRTYDIGPGRALARLGDLDWSRLGPGDTVNIHFKPGGYRELIQISSRGTSSSWIRIIGVPDPVTGELPAIDGRDAVLAPQFRNHWSGLHGYGAVVVGNRPGFMPGYKPGFIEIRSLEIRGCFSANTFTDVDGTRQPYGKVGAGVYLERCDHVTVNGCTIHDNGEGIFGAGQSTFDRLMTDVVVDSNRIYGNGNVGSDREHNTYIEAVGTVYQFNRYGPLRTGALGAGLKDRSVGTVIRGNWIEGGLHQLQIPEAQNQADLAVALPGYRTTIVQGNTLVAPPGNGASMIWFGGDQGVPAWYRKGVIYVHFNTFIARSDRSQNYKIAAIVAATGAEAIDARNNIVAAIPQTPGAEHADLGLVGSDNHAFFGRNWVTAGWVTTTVADYSFTGVVVGTRQFFVGPAIDPGFVDLAGGNYCLAATSPCVDEATRLPISVAAYPVDSQFRFPAGSAPRTMVGGAFDLGSFEVSATEPIASSLEVTVAVRGTTGAPVVVKVRALTAEGFVAQGYRGTVRLGCDDPRAVLPQAYTFTEADAGMHVFEMVFALPGQRRIDVADDAQSVASGRVTLTIAAAALTPPGGLRVASIGPSGVALTWLAHTTAATGFRIERMVVGGSWRTLAIVRAHETRFIDVTAPAGRTLMYRLRAIDTSSLPQRVSAPTATVVARVPFRSFVFSRVRW